MACADFSKLLAVMHGPALVVFFHGVVYVQKIKKQISE
jgi:hypothetical protein